jgi:hypothetical protein
VVYFTASVVGASDVHSAVFKIHNRLIRILNESFQIMQIVFLQSMLFLPCGSRGTGLSTAVSRDYSSRHDQQIS